MFRDLKEYQEIQRIYQNNVYDSPDDKLFEEAFKEFNTIEELDYLEENIEYVCEKQNFIQKGLQYINKLRKGLTNVKSKTNIKPKDVTKELEKAKEVIKKSDTVIKPNTKVTDIVKVDKTPKVKVDTPKVKVDTPKVNTDKSGVEKIKDAIKNNPLKSTAAAGGAVVGGALLTPGGEPEKEETPKVEEKPKEEEPKVEVKKEEPKKEKKEKPLLSKPIKSKTDLGSDIRQVKPSSARDKMIAKNEVKLGDDRVNLLRRQNADFQAMKKGKITKAQFIAQYPNSQTAKKQKLKNIKRGIKSSYDPIYNNNLANNLAEVYRNMYNTPSEPEVLGEENIQESPYGQITKMRRGKLKNLPKGPAPSKPDIPSKPDTAPVPKPDEPTTPKPRPGTGSMGPKGGESQRRESQIKKPQKMSKEDFGFDAYDLILEYLLGTEQVETIEEANYVMTEMDDQTIHSIVSEMEDALNEINEGMMGNVASGMKSVAGGATSMAGSAIKGGMSGAKEVAKKLMDAMKKLPKPNNPMPKTGM